MVSNVTIAQNETAFYENEQTFFKVEKKIGLK